MHGVAPDIRLQNLSLGYPGRVVIEDIDAVLPSGKISVILGGSGGGKSTLLRHILGLAVPLSGSIFFGEKNLFGLNHKEFMEIRKRMGVLFQDGALLSSMTLAENVALPLREHTQLDDDTIETVVKLKLNMVGLEPFIHYFPNQLSGGMRKRAGLARALALDPQVLMCDEPSAGLDPITAAELDQLILGLKRTFAMTIVVVTHDMESVFTIADHIVVLNNKQVVFQGCCEKMKTCTDTFIRQFLGRQPGKQAA